MRMTFLAGWLLGVFSIIAGLVSLWLIDYLDMRVWEDR